MYLKSILFDLTQCQATKRAKIHGGGEYGKTLLRYLAAKFPGVEITAVIFPGDAHLEASLAGFGNITLMQIGRLEQYADIIAKMDNSDYLVILSMPYAFYRVGIRFQRAQVVSVLHGLRYLECDTRGEDIVLAPGIGSLLRALGKYLIPKRIYNRRQLKTYRALLEGQKPGDVVATASRYTRDGVRMLVGAAVAPTLVTLYPLTPFEGRGEPVMRSGVVDIFTMLMLAGGRSEKNIIGVLRALTLLGDTDFVGRLTVLGVNSLQQAVLHRLFPRACSAVDFHDYVSSEQLKQLTGEARLLLFPSVSEGFGMPPIEAMAQGIPCVVSTASSIPEVCAYAAEYVDPHSHFEIAVKIYKFFKDPCCFKSMASLGVERYNELRREAYEMHDQFWTEMIKTRL